MPDPHDFHVPQPSYTRDELLRSSDGGYFGPGNAQLPAPPMLMMDRITEIRRGKLVLGIADGRVLADGTCVCVAKDMRVGLTKAAE
ncbi:hypothetical protein [Bradyrhizobium cosmicum]|uniref:hypothetical protein n=1 Tax=Bradyrhizobium cosmicum TaxID=1404864 RepID=UPI0028ED2393|nr:hypothetical protein [Bradyrhizobium cosmicum]